MPADPLDTLHHVFGFESFRGLQERAIGELMAGRDVVLVMPTGSGKSLCYQIPAICRDGCAIVVSPLIALMADQVRALAVGGVRAAALNSLSTEQATTMRDFRSGRLDLLYVAPERAATAAFRNLAREAPVSLIAIDEAHCVSEWGHDFRPDYRRLHELADALPGVPRIALTATADANTRADICEQLGISPDRLLVAGFDRPNICYRVEAKRQPAEQIRRLVEAQGKVPGIVYCQTRAAAEQTAEMLGQRGIPARAYHAGLAGEERMAAQKWFQRMDYGVMCATVAFGMGIDKPDIRYVIHLGLPKSIESYYQETGRAGRDGAPASAILLWGPQDVVLARQRIDQSEAAGERKRHERQMLQRLVSWAETTGCRRMPLLRHFGDEPAGPCGNCDNCLDPPTTLDLTEAARKLLSAVYRTGQRFGLGHVARVLRGDPDERIERHGHDQLPLYGIGRDLAQAQWLRLGRLLEASGTLARDPEHGGVHLSGQAREMLRGELPVAVRADDWVAAKRARKDRKDAMPAAPADSHLFEELRQWRRAKAEELDVPAYTILHDSTLAAIASMRPQSHATLHAIVGIGDVKLQRFGDELLAIVAGGPG